MSVTPAHRGGFDLRAWLFVPVIATMAFPADLWAFSESVVGIPNGNTLSCVLCHPVGEPLDQLNEMGVQTGDVSDDSRFPDWAALALLDADCDGFSNGVELGDPEGDWLPGEQPDSSVSYDPNDVDDFPPAGVPEQICPLDQDAGPPDAGPPDAGPVAGDVLGQINNNVQTGPVLGPVGCAMAPTLSVLLLALFALWRWKGHNQPGG